MTRGRASGPLHLEPVRVAVDLVSRMEAAVDKRIEALFRDYGKGFSALELGKTAHLYADTFVAAGPKGVISTTKDEFLKNADKAAEFYKSVGQERAEIRSMKETWFGEDYVMVTIHWAAFFKTLDKPAEFDVSYLVHVGGDKPKIILFISHEDEEEAMKKLGLLRPS